MAARTSDRLELERNLYQALIEIPDGRAEAWLQDILGRLVALAGARRGYVELYHLPDGQPERRLTASFQCTAQEEAEIATVTSGGIVASAIGTGTTIHTPMAMLDPRFSANASVQGQKLEAVLCVPFPGASPGVLYLEGPPGGGQFAAEDVAVAERVARYLGPVLSSVSLARVPGDDPTRPYRARLALEGVVGSSQALARVLAQMVQVASADITVLFLGETGTGKSALARALHATGPRAGGPFMEVNCAALQDTMVEAELFGTTVGTFTSARTTPGKVRAAEGGTLFLDEVGTLSTSSQAKLLQLLEEKCYFPVGSSRLERANVRVLAATNEDLKTAVDERQFRADLYYRLSAFSIRLPTLAERRSDLSTLVESLVDRAALEHRRPRLPTALSLWTAVEAREWPGNLRELKNALDRALLAATAEGASRLEARHLVDQDGASASGPRSLAQAVSDFRRELVHRELKDTGWNVAEVARRLDVARQHVYNLIKTYGLRP